jgi:hypothetical protein
MSDYLVRELGKMEERPWPEWRHRNPITVRQVARLLKPFGIRPKLLRAGDDVSRGYRLKDFEETFSRYLPPTPGSAPLHRYNVDVARVSAGSDPLHAEVDVTDENPLKASSGAGCNGVTDRIAQMEGGVI